MGSDVCVCIVQVCLCIDEVCVCVSTSAYWMYMYTVCVLVGCLDHLLSTCLTSLLAALSSHHRMMCYVRVEMSGGHLGNA